MQTLHISNPSENSQYHFPLEFANFQLVALYFPEKESLFLYFCYFNDINVTSYTKKRSNNMSTYNY